MPGLPKNLLITYQRFQSHTDSIAQWLASTAKNHGYTTSKGIGAIKAPKANQGHQTYTVAIKEWAALAGYIAKQDPPILVPARLAAFLEINIRLRQSYVEIDSGRKPDAHDHHAIFLRVLENVRDALESRLPTERISAEKFATTADIVNLFEHLDLEEPSEAVEQASDIIPPAAATSGPVYMAERPTDINESSLALILLLHDFNRLRTEVSMAWARCQAGSQDLVVAAVATNTAVELARSMSEDLKSIFSKHGGEIHMLERRYTAQCMPERTLKTYKACPEDELSPDMLEVADVMFWPAYQLLAAFRNVLTHKTKLSQEMRRGILGHYDPHSDRSRKTNHEKIAEDKTILLDILPEFFYYCRSTEKADIRLPVEDEFSRGLRTFFKTKEITLPLAFAATLFLDIHHILRDKVDVMFYRLTVVTHFVQGDIKEELKFHEGIKMETWPKENDMVLQQFVDTLHFWCQEDQQLIAAKRLNREHTPEGFYLYRKHPWMCGLWKHYAQMRFHELSIVFVNAWGSVMSCAHLYNALEKRKPLETYWKDFKVLAPLQGKKAFFSSDPPLSADDCLQQFVLAMGASAPDLAKSTHKKKGLVLSKRGPKGLEELGPVLRTFKSLYCDGNGQTNLRAEDVQNILDNSIWDYEFKGNRQVYSFLKDEDTAMRQKTSTSLPLPKFLSIIRDATQGEMVAVQFDYLRLHRQCWRLLRFLKDKCREDLIEMFGPDYITKESELPLVVGYVLMSAASTHEVGNLLKARLPGVMATDKVMEDATGVFIKMIQEGAGNLIMDQILPKGLGLEIGLQRRAKSEHV